MKRVTAALGKSAALHLSCVLVALSLLNLVACAKREAAGRSSDEKESSRAGGGAAPLPTAATESQTQDDAGYSMVGKQEKVMASPALVDALKVTREEFRDIPSQESALVAWASDKLKWSEVETKKNESSTLLALKDPFGAYGKRACLTGKVADIQAVRGGDAGALSHFQGRLESAAEVWSVVAVGDTGELVRGSSAKFCGFVTGVTKSAKGDAGQVDALAVIGMFDLPSNRKQ